MKLEVPESFMSLFLALSSELSGEEYRLLSCGKGKGWIRVEKEELWWTSHRRYHDQSWGDAKCASEIRNGKAFLYFFIFKAPFAVRSLESAEFYFRCLETKMVEALDELNRAEELSRYQTFINRFEDMEVGEFGEKVLLSMAVGFFFAIVCTLGAM